MAYDGSIKIDTKIDTGGFKTGIDKLKGLAKTGVSAITTTLAGIATTLGTGATAAATVGSSFEAAMSKVSAISGASGKDLQSLTDKAKEMGAKTKFSASESAEALQYMAMAGWNTTSMLNGIDGIMSLAAADGLDLATTSDIVTDAITAFGLKASDSTHFADVLAKASSSANTNVSMLGESFKYVAPLAGAMNYSVEDVSVALGLMANASVKGSMAGTSLKTALSNLASPTKEMQKVMDEYKISMIDANGEALPLIDVIKELRTKFSGLSETEQTAAASTLFGKEAMSGMLAIINASDKDFNTLVKNIDNADGSAKAMAETMQNNLQGQITILKSGLEGLGIEIYESMSEPLTDAAKEAQNYVNRLTTAFTEGGLSGMIEEAGSIFGELATKAVEATPKMIDAAMSFLQAFVNGIANNSSKLVKAAINIVKTLVRGISDRAPDLLSAAKSIVDALTKNLVKLLPKELQAPVKEAINTIKKSFENGGLKKAINTVKTILINLGETITNIAKVVIPPLAKAIDIVADNLNILLPIVTTAVTAWKAWQIISAITALVKEHAASVTAESLAEAASLGTITLKQIAVGALTGEITLATAAQYAWNLAMSLNPAVLILTGITALTAGIVAFSAANGDATQSTNDLVTAEESLKTANDNLSETYEGIGDKISEFMDGVNSSSGVLDGFNDSIILSKDKQQELADKMDSVQTEITEIARTAKEKRTELTDEEIQRLDDLFAKQKELADQQLEVQQQYQNVTKDMAKDLVADHDMSLEEYEQYSQEYSATAQQTRDNTIKAAEEQRTNWLAEKRALIGTDKQYTEEWYNKQREQANKDYKAAVDEANKVCGDTISILQKGYYNRANVLQNSTKDLKKLNQDEADENATHKNNLESIDAEYNRDLNDFLAEEKDNRIAAQKYKTYLDSRDRAITDENTRHTKKQGEIRNQQTKILNDDNYQKQLAGFLGLESLYETYTGKTGEHSKEIVDAFFTPMKNMPKDTKESYSQSMEGAIKGLDEKKNSLYLKAVEITGGFINTVRRMLDEHSPSKVFKKIFAYTLEGGENGLDDEAPNLYKQADDVASTFTERMQAGVSADGLVSKMRSAVNAGQAMLRSKFTADVNHNVELMSEDNERKYNLKGDIHTSINIDGRETAVALTPYVSEELAWEDR